MPLWVGLQAPCTTGFYTFSDNPTQAAADGKNEADSATGTIARASGLGLSKTVIYYDLEQYNTTNDPNCGPSATAFIGAWINEMQKNGYSAGVYVNMYGARDQVSKASPGPNEVWVPKWDNRATIWGLGVLNDTLWMTDQRAHQFLAPHNETWGSVTIQVDADIEDAPAAGSNGAKPTYAYSYADEGEQFTYGINDVVINPATGQLDYNFSGQYVGIGSCVNTSPAIPCIGFLSDPVVGPDSVTYSDSTEANGVNNQDEVVGHSIAQAAYLHGLIDQISYSGSSYSNSYSSWDYPGTTGGTVFNGVNDDGQIAGLYYNGPEGCGVGCSAGFVRNADGTHTDINYSGAVSIYP